MSNSTQPAPRTAIQITFSRKGRQTVLVASSMAEANSLILEKESDQGMVMVDIAMVKVIDTDAGLNRIED